MISFARDVVTVVRAATYVERGDTIFDWADVTTHDISGCIVQPMVGEEILGDRDAVVRRWKGFLPHNSDLLETDRVVHLGLTYEIDGYVQRWPSPTGALKHDEITLKRVEG